MRKMDIARLIANKIAYQWFGNVITPFWWSSLWLHEGLATLFGEEAVVKVFTFITNIVINIITISKILISCLLCRVYNESVVGNR